MNLENITYYNIVRFLHLIGMAAWFGTALCVSIIWSRKNINDKTLILDLITKVEMPASFFIPLTGVLMSIDKMHWLSLGWMQMKICVGLLTVVFTHLSRAKLIHSDMEDEYIKQKFTMNRNLGLLGLSLILLIVGFN
ncbi:MAG: hypothetical protein ACJZ1P_08215 [Candidatus Neomarinimicrobiota bacterium]|tara:strand:- start:3774 stop:4184 length:411 start_codon:yes stop_codon:yes gene_type:complete